MIAALLWLAQIVIGSPAPSSPLTYPQLPPAVVLDRYAAAVRKLKEPRVISFDYTLEQTGARALSQTHRVFRAGDDERDETLTVDGKRLSPPKVRIFRGRRDRYTIALLAPRAADYLFAYIGPRKDGRHIDYVFRLTPKTVRAFAVTDVTIDGVRFLPLAIGFSTGSNAGAGSIAFGSNARWWVPYVATASANVAANPATERLSFYTYRFPPTLPPSTFSQARRPASTGFDPHTQSMRSSTPAPLRTPPVYPSLSRSAPSFVPSSLPSSLTPPARSHAPLPVRSPLVSPVTPAPLFMPVRPTPTPGEPGL